MPAVGPVVVSISVCDFGGALSVDTRITARTVFSTSAELLRDLIVQNIEVTSFPGGEQFLLQEWRGFDDHQSIFAGLVTCPSCKNYVHEEYDHSTRMGNSTWHCEDEEKGYEYKHDEDHVSLSPFEEPHPPVIINSEFEEGRVTPDTFEHLDRNVRGVLEDVMPSYFHEDQDPEDDGSRSWALEYIEDGSVFHPHEADYRRVRDLYLMRFYNVSYADLLTTVGSEHDNIAELVDLVESKVDLFREANWNLHLKRVFTTLRGGIDPSQDDAAVVGRLMGQAVNWLGKCIPNQNLNPMPLAWGAHMELAIVNCWCVRLLEEWHDEQMVRADEQARANADMHALNGNRRTHIWQELTDAEEEIQRLEDRVTEIEVNANIQAVDAYRTLFLVNNNIYMSGWNLNSTYNYYWLLCRECLLLGLNYRDAQNFASVQARNHNKLMHALNGNIEIEIHLPDWMFTGILPAALGYRLSDLSWTYLILINVVAGLAAFSIVCSYYPVLRMKFWRFLVVCTGWYSMWLGRNFYRFYRWLNPALPEWSDLLERIEEWIDNRMQVRHVMPNINVDVGGFRVGGIITELNSALSDELLRVRQEVDQIRQDNINLQRERDSISVQLRASEQEVRVAQQQRAMAEDIAVDTVIRNIPAQKPKTVYEFFGLPMLGLIGWFALIAWFLKRLFEMYWPRPTSEGYSVVEQRLKGFLDTVLTLSVVLAATDGFKSAVKSFQNLSVYVRMMLTATSSVNMLWGLLPKGTPQEEAIREVVVDAPAQAVAFVRSIEQIAEAQREVDEQEEKVDVGHDFVDAVRDLFQDRTEQIRAHRLLGSSVPPLDRTYFEAIYGYFQDHPRVFAATVLIAAAIVSGLLYFLRKQKVLEGIKVTEVEQTLVRVTEITPDPVVVQVEILESKLEDDFHKPKLEGNVIGACVDVKPEKVSVVSNCCDAVEPTPVKVLECIHAADCPIYDDMKSDQQTMVSMMKTCNVKCDGHHCTHWAECKPILVLERHKKKKRDLPVSREYNPNARKGDDDYIEVDPSSQYYGAVHRRKAGDQTAYPYQEPDDEEDDDYKRASEPVGYRPESTAVPPRDPSTWSEVAIKHKGQQRREEEAKTVAMAPVSPPPIKIQRNWAEYAQICRNREKNQWAHFGSWKAMRNRPECDAKTEDGVKWCIDEKCMKYHLIPPCPRLRENKVCSEKGCIYYHPKPKEKGPKVPQKEGNYRDAEWNSKVAESATFVLYSKELGDFTSCGLGHATYNSNHLLSNSHLAKGDCWVEKDGIRYPVTFYPHAELDYSEARWSEQMGKRPASASRAGPILGAKTGKYCLQPAHSTTIGDIVKIPSDMRDDVEYTNDSKRGHCGSGVWSMEGKLIGLHRADMQNGHNGFIRIPAVIGACIPKKSKVEGDKPLN